LHPGILIAFDSPGFRDISRSDQAVLVVDLNDTDAVDESTPELLGASGFSSALFQPIIVRGRWFGLLVILFQSRHLFVQSEINFYRTLADQAALAFEGQHLLAETQHRAEREQLIRQISDKVRSTTDLDKILQTTVEELGKAMGLPRVFVKLGTEMELLTERRSEESGLGGTEHRA
jgi:GAF domain-containing protein